MKHIHDIYDLYLYLESVNCDNCKEFNNRFVGVFVDEIQDYYFKLYEETHKDVGTMKKVKLMDREI